MNRLGKASGLIWSFALFGGFWRASSSGAKARALCPQRTNQLQKEHAPAKGRGMQEKPVFAESVGRGSVEADYPIG